MVEVLRLRVIYGKFPLWESLCRNLIVIACFILLGISAEYGSENYRKMEKEAEHSGKDTYMEMVPEMVLDIVSVFDEKKIELSPIGKINLSEMPRPLHLEEAESIVPRRPEQTEEKRIVPESVKVTEKPEAAEIRTTEEKSTVSESAVTDKIKDIPIADSEASEKSEEKIEEKIPEDTVTATEITVTVYGNGGMPEVAELSCERNAFTLDTLVIPKRLGKLFGGWYIDAECSVPFAGIEEGAEALVLYAGWKEFPGFFSNDLGHIVSCADTVLASLDGFLRIPGYEECTGIERGAFENIRDSVFEVYIPANITYIEKGVFDSLSRLMYIEAAPGNPSYYSENGILYNSNGTVAAYPAGWEEER